MREHSILFLLIPAIPLFLEGSGGPEGLSFFQAVIFMLLVTVTTAYPCMNTEKLRLSANRAAFVAIITSSPGLAGAALSMSGLLAGTALLGFRCGEKIFSKETVLYLLSGAMAIILLTGTSRFYGPISAGYLRAAAAFLLVICSDLLISGVFLRIRTSRIAGLVSRYLLVYSLLTPVSVVLIRASMTGNIGLLAAVSLPLAAYSILIDNREALVWRQRRKTSELSVQNELVRDLMNTDSATGLLRLVDDYFRRDGNMHPSSMILSSLPDGKGWMVWSGLDQVSLGSDALPLNPPGINELSETCSFRAITGGFMGLSADRNLLLFVNKESAELLAGMPADVRNNLVLLLNQSWQVMGHHMKSEEAFLAAAVMLARLVDSKDDYTHGHSLRVADMACAIGTRMGLCAEDMKTLRVGALLHDLGKIAINTEILTKKGLLTTEERKSIERHSAEGAAIVSRLRGYSSVAEIIMSHHEKLDGRGYPGQVSGREIPFLARIVTVADTFDAITSTRSYHTLIDQMTALDTIIEGRGIQFDARVVDALREIISSSSLERAGEYGA